MYFARALKVTLGDAACDCLTYREYLAVLNFMKRADARTASDREPFREPFQMYSAPDRLDATNGVMNEVYADAVASGHAKAIKFMSVTMEIYPVPVGPFWRRDMWDKVEFLEIPLSTTKLTVQQPKS